MRFAYIDSQGNEVPIPSIDALALRIELGAVGPDTQLYDAQADHWGPAHTHEIFHSLSRDSEDEGFLAPPPPVAQPSDAAPEIQAEAEAEPAPEPEREPEPEPEEAIDAGDMDLGLTLAAPPPPPEETAEAAAPPDEAPLDLADSSDMPLIAEAELSVAPEPLLSAAPDAPLVGEFDAPAASAGEPLASETLELAGGSAPAEEDGGFDFGDLGGGLEMEDAPEPGGMELDTEMEFQGPAADFDAGGEALDLEQPMSAFEPDSPPGWMEESGPDDVMDFSTLAAEEEASESVAAPVAEAPARQRRTPKDRPSPPKFKSQRSPSGPIAFVVVALAVGVGGYYAWPIIQARLAEADAPERPPVVMPALSEELMPQMRSIGESAIAAVVSDVGESTSTEGAPDGPDDDWLAGVYLGNASQYPGVEAFWSGMASFTQGLRAAEWQLYHERYVEAAAQAGLEADVAAQVTQRADSGFVAAQPQRSLAYGELERLTDAALELHSFLLDNEADIVFRPGVTNASDPSVDPVLEIQAPADDREQMLGMFDEITDALDALGSLDRVTRDRLIEAMTARLQQVGIQ